MSSFLTLRRATADAHWLTKRLISPIWEPGQMPIVHHMHLFTALPPAFILWRCDVTWACMFLHGINQQDLLWWPTLMACCGPQPTQFLRVNLSAYTYNWPKRPPLITNCNWMPTLIHTWALMTCCGSLPTSDLPSIVSYLRAGTDVNGWWCIL